MRVLFSLVALVAGAQALSSPSHQKRGGSDTCANLNCGVSLANPANGKSMDFGNMNQCSCLSQVSSTVKSNSALSWAVSVCGNSKVTDFLSGKIREEGKYCEYPDHATPACTPENPCGFTCGDGYSLSGNQCVCRSPYKECGGKCGVFTNCPSKSAQRREADEWERHVRCEQGHTACGTLWSPKFSREAYECVDVKNNLESCGGCSIPLHRGSPLGTDCTSLPGVADVSCMNGSCYVHKCMPGYQLAVDNSMCMDEETVNKFTNIVEFELEWLRPIRLD